MISMVAGTPNERAIVTGELTVRTAAVKSHPAYATCLILCIPRPRSHCMPLKNLDLHIGTWNATIYRWGPLYSLHIVMCRIHKKSNVWTIWISTPLHSKESLTNWWREWDIWNLIHYCSEWLLQEKKNESIEHRVSHKNKTPNPERSPHKNASASREERVEHELVMEKFLRGCWMLHQKQCPRTGSTGLLTITREKFK